MVVLQLPVTKTLIISIYCSNHAAIHLTGLSEHRFRLIIPAVFLRSFFFLIGTLPNPQLYYCQKVQRFLLRILMYRGRSFLGIFGDLYSRRRVSCQTSQHQCLHARLKATCGHTTIQFSETHFTVQSYMFVAQSPVTQPSKVPYVLLQLDVLSSLLPARFLFVEIILINSRRSVCCITYDMNLTG